MGVARDRACGPSEADSIALEVPDQVAVHQHVVRRDGSDAVVVAALAQGLRYRLPGSWLPRTVRSLASTPWIPLNSGLNAQLVGKTSLRPWMVTRSTSSIRISASSATLGARTVAVHLLKPRTVRPFRPPSMVRASSYVPGQIDHDVVGVRTVDGPLDARCRRLRTAAAGRSGLAIVIHPSRAGTRPGRDRGSPWR